MPEEAMGIVELVSDRQEKNRRKNYYGHINNISIVVVISVGEKFRLQ